LINFVLTQLSGSQALYLLLQCGHNVEEAMRRQQINAASPVDTMSLWSEEECRNFENGLRQYGKDFITIQMHKVFLTLALIYRFKMQYFQNQNAIFRSGHGL